jgi:hypothetical protein
MMYYMQGAQELDARKASAHEKDERAVAPNDDECILEFYCSLYPDRFIHEADDLTFGAHRKGAGGKGGNE